MDESSVYPISPPYEEFYFTSMLFHTISALTSLQSFNILLRHFQEDPSSVPPHEPLNHLQNVILHGAALSRYFWPSRNGKKRDARAKALRHSFEMTADSPLKSRDLRNDLEHFDERLDEYLAEGIEGFIIPNYFEPMPQDAGVYQHFLRAYYTDTDEFEVLGQRFAIEPIAKEIQRIHGMLVDLDRTGRIFSSER